MTASALISLAERGLIPLPGLRLGVRHLLHRRLSEVRDGPNTDDFVRMLSESRVALETDKANEQHYEVPVDFFELVLGPHLKYSSAFWTDGTRDLGKAERLMLELSAERADLADGQDILELGCGWGSMTLYMARAYPHSRITAVSNSASQRSFIESRAPTNVRVITADMNDFDTDERFDRVVSIEMFEHMRNYGELLRRIGGWLRSDGSLFVHLFCHRDQPYCFETEGEDNWLGRYFFTGGIMPSFELIQRFDDRLRVEKCWRVDGTHYSKTARAWRNNLEARRDQIIHIFEGSYGGGAFTWYHRWRLFFLACEELFGYRGGSEWMVGHYLLRSS